MKRRLITLLVVAVGTATGSLWWLYDGDLIEAVEPVVSSEIGYIDAAMLLERAGLDGDALAAPERYPGSDAAD